MPKCCQCDKQAIVNVGGNPFCVDCNLKFQQAIDMQNARLAQEYNFLSDQIDAVIGLDSGLPRYHIPQPVIHNAPITFNNIKVDKSIVGSINIGNVHNIDVAMTNLKNSGNEPLAQELARFTQAILDDAKAGKAQKDEILEYLSYISMQVSLPAEKRKSSMIKTVLSAIDKGVGSIANWLTIWTTLQPMILAAIGSMK